jgi:hypothetical protein
MHKSEGTHAVGPRSEYLLAGMVGEVLGIEGRRLQTLTGKNTEVRVWEM